MQANIIIFFTKCLKICDEKCSSCDFLPVGNCKSGSKCKFAHGLKELVKLDPPKIEDGGVFWPSACGPMGYIYIIYLNFIRMRPAAGITLVVRQCDLLAAETLPQTLDISRH